MFFLSEGLVGMRTNVAMAAVSTWISQCRLHGFIFYWWRIDVRSDILQSRVLALYQSNYVSRFLYVAFCAEVIGLLIFTGLSIPKLKGESNLPNLKWNLKWHVQSLRSRFLGYITALSPRFRLIISCSGCLLCSLTRSCSFWPWDSSTNGGSSRR